MCAALFPVPTQEDEVVLTAESNLSNLSFTGGASQQRVVLLELQGYGLWC
jgi:hypothetical protein